MSVDPLKLQHEADQTLAYLEHVRKEHERVGLTMPADMNAKGAFKPLFAALMARGELERIRDLLEETHARITVFDRIMPTPPESESDQ